MEINKFIFVGGLVCSLIGFGGGAIFNRIRINRLNREVNDLSNVLEDRIVKSIYLNQINNTLHNWLTDLNDDVDSLEKSNKK